MRAHYDFSNAIRNPYVSKDGRKPGAKILKRRITLRIDKHAIAYFQELGSKTGLPYQSLINYCLRDFAEIQRKGALERVLLFAKFDKGIKQADAGQTISHDKMKQKMRRWLKKS